MSETIGWDEATQSSGFVRIEPDKEKKILITNWRLENKEKFGQKQIEFSSDVMQEDGEKTEGKTFTTTSKRLLKKLKPILEGKNPQEMVSISIMRVGSSYDTQYSVREV